MTQPSPPLSGAAVVLAVALLASSALFAQAPEESSEILHTFSIVAIDPATGESGLAITTRNPCVGNRVYWVRAGVGAVASQANLRIEYGPEILDLLEQGVAPEEALRRAMANDAHPELRQLGAITLDGRTAQHTGSGASPWAGHRAGRHYATQGNILAGPQVIDAVAASFEASEESGRHLADRLIDAIGAGYAVGGDRRMGRQQSAAVLVADPRPGVALRPDRITVNISVCEHADPVAELRRVYDAVSQTLAYRTLQRFDGRDVLQLRVILDALGYLSFKRSPDADRLGSVYTEDLIEAVDTFRRDQGLSTADAGSPSGLVDRQMVERLWAALERTGKAKEVRERIHDLVLAFRPGSPP